ncbi:uncharacterized protein LOC131538402 isoform X3 [Onychostoma macrolepis]|uniref:uncharacterized protein LOC131538402 isoform X3 n=1 Tax=Onychostoma macrolepis TaxID=369639 RepID=UPI002729A689|nr:uncharacterized protein LOC131538402 isoform X3 [Onychostoma macrolepis]
MEKTPKTSEELTLLQAGMGCRTISIAEDAEHSWLSKKLEEAYCKLAELKGAWVLYKAVAKEFAKMPKATCQTCGDNMPVQLLAAHAASCETMTLSTDLDEQSEDFQRSPDNVDPSTSTSVDVTNSPDHTLPVGTSVTDSSDLDRPSIYVPDVKTACPIWEQFYPSDFVEIHASFCGERYFLVFQCIIIFRSKLLYYTVVLLLCC